MKILIATEHLDIGGVERFAVNLANGFIEAQQQVDLFLFIGTRMQMASHLDKRIRVQTMGLRYFKTVFRLLFRFPAFVRLIRQNNYDLIISAKVIPSVITLAACCLAGKRKKLVITVHESCQDIIREHRGIRKLFFIMAYHLLYRISPRIVAVSRQAGDDIIALSGIAPEKVSVIYNPVITKEFAHVAQEEASHSWLQEKTVPVILTAGRFTKQKNYELLLHAFAMLNQTHPCRLIILGDGEDRGKLVQLAGKLQIAGSVSMPGIVDNPYAYMSRADLFVLSSIHEALPTVLIEAMACRCPVVSTDCPHGPREILADGQYGTLVAMNNPDALAKAMKHTLSTRDTINGDVLRKRAVQFSQENAVKQYLQLAL